MHFRRRIFSRTDFGKGKSILQVTLDQILTEICGDDLRGKIKEYTNNFGSAFLFNGIISLLVTIAALYGISIDGA
ncbi:MAG: hypothetical protein V7L20_13230 [Nostoc sp.]|uniref:hypothetical protein n=1 Tax=Nostoc sp. TaxID=1180 RepID=UPI002FFD49CD